MTSPQDPNRFPDDGQVGMLDEAPDGDTPSDQVPHSKDSLPPEPTPRDDDGDDRQSDPGGDSDVSS